MRSTIPVLKARDSKAQGKAAKQPQPWVLKRREVSPERAELTSFTLLLSCAYSAVEDNVGTVAKLMSTCRKTRNITPVI
jgi:hypothetical protein